MKCDYCEEIEVGDMGLCEECTDTAPKLTLSLVQPSELFNSLKEEK